MESLTLTAERQRPVPSKRDPLMLLSGGGAELPRKFAVAIEHPIYGVQYRLRTAEEGGPFWHPFITDKTMLFDFESDAARAVLAVKGFADLMGSVYMTARVEPITPESYRYNA